MIEPLASSMANVVGIGVPKSPAHILRSPRNFQINNEGLEDSYLENLIQKNIIEKNQGSYRSRFIASEVRALINSLSEEHKRKLREIVQAFEADKEMIKGAIFSGGEIRVVAESGSAMVINTIAELLGITYSSQNQTPSFSNFAGTSAGAFLASGFAFRSLNSSIFRSSADTDFTSFHRAPEKLESWANKFLRKGFHITTGKFVDIIRVEHMDEIGSNFQCLVGEWALKFPPIMQTFLLPRDFKRKFGINPSSIEVKKLIRATANLPILLYSLLDLFETCGDCYFVDKKGRKRYFFDPGIHQKNLLLIELQKEEIRKYRTSRIQQPGLYFVVGNKKAKTQNVPDVLLGKPASKLIYWIYENVVHLSDLFDEYVMGLAVDDLKDIGAHRGYIEARCEATSPFTGEVAMLAAGNLSVPRNDREILICANIPTGDFKDLDFESTIDQLHRNFVDPVFIATNGQNGKSAYQLFLEDVNKANHIPPADTANYKRKIWEAKAAIL